MKDAILSKKVIVQHASKDYKGHDDNDDNDVNDVNDDDNDDDDDDDDVHKDDDFNDK